MCCSSWSVVVLGTSRPCLLPVSVCEEWGCEGGGVSVSVCMCVCVCVCGRTWIRVVCVYFQKSENSFLYCNLR